VSAPKSTVTLILSGQLWHLLSLLLLGFGLYLAADLPGFSNGSLFGVSTDVWLVLVVANAVIHQIYVWLCWRLELHGQCLTAALGENAFPLYAFLFSVLILARPVLMTLLAVSNSGTVVDGTQILAMLGVLFIFPVIYLGYSVRRYFGFYRAFGADHFDPACRQLPMVKDGIFRYSGNSMYLFGFLLLWIPGLIAGSVAALVAAALSHAYIWVHYWCTEKPDMQWIYGKIDTGG
jgi:hypothetical protein